MRTFLLSAVASVSLLAGTDRVQESPEQELTPVQMQLIESYWQAQDLESKPHQDALREIHERYERTIRRALPEEKHKAFERIAGRC